MRKKAGQKIFAIVLFSGVLILLARGGQLEIVKSVAGKVVSPITQGFFKTGSGIRDFLEFMGSIKDVAKHNAELEREVVELKNRLAQDVELRVQNEILRRQLNFSSSSTQKLLPAEVTAYQPDNFRAFIMINKGLRDGLREGMVVTSEGSLVGKITEIGQTSAKVFLLIDPEFKVAALDQNSPNRATGTVRGQIGRGLFMDKIPQDQQIKPGDTVITSGLGGDFPKGLVIGRVESVNQKDNAVFQTAQIVSDVKFSQLEIVFVVAE